MSGDNLDPLYMAMRDANHVDNKAQQDHCEALWATFQSKKLADSHFLTEFSQRTKERYWEMYLGCTLVELGLNPEKVSDSGPDFLIAHNGRRYWIEATCPGPGDISLPDSVPNQSIGGNIVHEYPHEQVILRYTNALSLKKCHRNKNIEAGIINKEDGYIISISASGLNNHIPSAKNPNSILQTLFPVGQVYVNFGKDRADQAEVGVHDKHHILKTGGKEVSTDAFVNPEWNWLSAVIFEPIGLERVPLEAPMGSSFHTVHNPLADVPLNHCLINRGEMYRLSLEQYSWPS